MKRAVLIGLVLVGVLFVIVTRRTERRRSTGTPPGNQPTVSAHGQTSPTSVKSPAKPIESSNQKTDNTPVPKPLSADEKQARVDKIKRDYDEIRARTSAEYTAAGNSFPGGLSAFLRQLALLEKEKRTDLAAILSQTELEDLELRETTAGQLVQRLLAEAPITDGQRRTVFRLQRQFDESYGLTYNVTPRGLYEREAARQGLQEQIRAVLGDDVFATWLRGEGDDYARFAAFASQQKLPANAALDLWRAKNDFTLQRLDLLANQGTAKSPEQLRAAQAGLTLQMESRVLSIVGPGLMDRARAEVLGWLPKKW